MIGNGLQFKGKVKEQWGKGTNDDLDDIAGKRDPLLDKLQERHGITLEEAKKQISADYKAAKERCDSLADAVKDTCVSDAKAKFGK